MSKVVREALRRVSMQRRKSGRSQVPINFLVASVRESLSRLTPRFDCDDIPGFVG